MKTKQAKQNEAIERNRQGFVNHRITWLECQEGGERYERMKKKYGQEEADKLRTSANKKFEAAAAAAHVDKHGNPLEK